MFMVGGYHKGEGEERFKDRDISVHLSDINIYSIRDVCVQISYDNTFDPRFFMECFYSMYTVDFIE
jgi:hypothetical protein